MIAVFTAPDALVAAAVVAMIGNSVAAAWNAHEARRQMKPNGGSSLRDAIDRIEARQKTMVDDVRDLKSDVSSVKADVRDGHQRILALEHERDPNSRDRAGDAPFDWAHALDHEAPPVAEESDETPPPAEPGDLSSDT